MLTDPAPIDPMRAYPPWARTAAGALVALGRASLPAILAVVLVATDPPVTPPILVRLVAAFAVLPGLAAWLLGRVFTVRAEVRNGHLTLVRRGLRVEVPCAAIADVAAWRVPLPGPGITLRMRSGHRLGYGLQASDPTPLLHALAGGGGVPAAATAAAHPVVVYAHARRAGGPWRWYHLAGRFPGFALLPTMALFNVHQHIAYGAFLGEYYLMGLRSWLATFAVYWTTVTIYLVLYASVWRGLVEGVALAAARVAPSRAARVRRAAEAVSRVLYYAGVPVLLAIRFLP